MKNSMTETLLGLINFVIVTPMLVAIGAVIGCFMFIFFIAITVLQMGQLMVYFIKGEHKKAKWINDGKKK